VVNAIIKAAAVVRAGYEYQDLVGIGLLIRYFRAPDLYNWVKLEAEETAYGALDDVVVARADGSFEFTQVKFTVDEGANLLEWDWLLKKKPKGTSMLAKWANSLAKVRALGPVHSAELRTNRLPSSDFAASMRGDFVDLGLLDDNLRKKVEVECGGTTQATVFFDGFAFKSGEKDLDAFEHAVKSELVPSHLDPSGWTYFRDQVRRWAMRRNEPLPDGKITHRHLSQIITRKRSEPIRQDFHIPEGYQMPSAAFHSRFKTRIGDAATSLTVVWGTPGRGKSTYLSFLTDELRKAGKAVIRHHYFLSAEDTSDRMSYFEIANSLFSQLLDHYPDAIAGAGRDYDQLRKNLETAASYFAQHGERLYLVIDGLDHVWRDTQKVDQLNFLFNKLLPLPGNVSLIVGTQRVDARRLPSRLVSAAKPKDWIEIPAMDQVVVHRWIESQDKAGRLWVLGDPKGARRQEQINEIGWAFFDVSQGHPLHLIYAFESLTRSGRPVRAEDVEHIPRCPDGDIRTYYENLWNNLDGTSREILHLLSGSDFYWPSIGVRQCVGNFDDISFLLENRKSGVVPFHGSIFAYVRERDDHVEAFEALLPRLVRWLQTDSPPFWRWGWLWLYQARLGDYSGLMNGVSRDWAVASLAEGWPERQAVKILEAAEAHSFSQGDLVRTVKLRSIKTRLMNARQFQIENYADFEEAAIASAKNIQQLRNLADQIPSLSDDEVLMLAKVACDSVNDDIVDACIVEYRRRINVWIELRHRPDGEFMTITHLLLDAEALAKRPDIQRVLRFLKGFRDAQPHIVHLIERLGARGNVDALWELRALLNGARWEFERSRVEDEIVRACRFIGADPFTRLTASAKRLSPLRASWLRLHKPAVPIRLALYTPPKGLIRDRYDYGIDLVLRDFFHDVFFSALATALSAEGEYEFCYTGLAHDQLGWVAIGIDTLQETAKEIASGRLKPSFSAPFLGAADLSNVAFGRRATESDAAQYRSFVAALRRIALDLHLIALAPGASPAIDKEEFEIARGSSHSNDEVWLELALEIGMPILSKEAALALWRDSVDKLDKTISEFNERAAQWVLLARFGLHYKLDDAGALVQRAASCLLGYGWRKDPWIFDVLDAVAEIHHPITTPALGWIRTLVPIIDKITEFTDGDETRHARTDLIEVVAKTYPDRLQQLFKAHIDRDEWKYADECLKAFVKVSDLSDPQAAALATTLLDVRTLEALEFAAKNCPSAAQLFEHQLEFLGGRPIDHDHCYARSDIPDMGKAKRRDPKKRGPRQFAKLVNDTKDLRLPHGDISTHFSTWLNHWKDQGKGKEALDDIRAYFQREERAYFSSDVLDPAFQVSLAVEGRDLAYWFLVAAQIHKHGWQSFWSSEEEVMQRLRWASEHYRDRWMDFIKDSSRPENFYAKREYGFSIGQRYLVRFLLLVEQRDLAAKIVDQFVNSIVEELRDQPIPVVPWFQ